MPPKKVQDDTKQCTLSMGGGVLSPSAQTLHDTKQPRITHLFGGGRAAPNEDVKVVARSKLQLQKSKKPDPAALLDQEIPGDDVKLEEPQVHLEEAVAHAGNACGAQSWGGLKKREGEEGE